MLKVDNLKMVFVFWHYLRNSVIWATKSIRWKYSFIWLVNKLLFAAYTCKTFAGIMGNINV